MRSLSDFLGGWCRFGILAVLLPIALSGCIVQAPVTGVSAPGSAGLSPVEFSAIPGWDAATVRTGFASFVRSCRMIEVLPEDQSLGGDGLAAALGGKAGQWRAACAAARAVPPGDAEAAKSFFKEYFTPYLSASETRLSGYFEPVYEGSELKRRDYTVPIYGKPRDLVHANLSAFKDSSGQERIVGRLRYGVLVPYYTRSEINEGLIAHEASVVAWLKNPVDAYMAQLQGSARLRLPDGTQIDLEFDGTNGRTYTPIGKLMVEKGYLAADQVSIQSITAWLRAHPEEATALMDANKNYVFMKRIKGLPDDLGAPGALGVPLTPEGSIAVDEKAIPLGTPVFVATKTMDRLLTAQDIDVSAHGASSAQIFFGIGPNAASLAGAEHEQGRIFILLPRPNAPAAKQNPAPGANP